MYVPGFVIPIPTAAVPEAIILFGFEKMHLPLRSYTDKFIRPPFKELTYTTSPRTWNLEDNWFKIGLSITPTGACVVKELRLHLL